MDEGIGPPSSVAAKHNQVDDDQDNNDRDRSIPVSLSAMYIIHCITLAKSPVDTPNRPVFAPEDAFLHQKTDASTRLNQSMW